MALLTLRWILGEATNAGEFSGFSGESQPKIRRKT
jgi:hypothetical protein